MKFHVLTLFPEMISGGLNLSVIGKAVENNRIALHAVDIREYSLERHRKVDDYPYGGGAGMLMQAQPIYDAHRAVTEGRNVRTIYVTPQGIPFTQTMAEELSEEEELVFLCGHYEGIDERVLEEIVTDYVSIGDYVLTGGELPAMVMIDAIARLIPGVLGNDTSMEDESFHNDLLEYPHYTRPEIWHEKGVPQVLLSGNHAKVSAWRLEQSKIRTQKRRPDLYAKYEKRQLLITQLSKDKRNHIHMMESLARGTAEVIYENQTECGVEAILYDSKNKICMSNSPGVLSESNRREAFCADAEYIVINRPVQEQDVSEEDAGSAFKDYCVLSQCKLMLYTARTSLPVKHKNIRLVSDEDIFKSEGFADRLYQAGICADGHYSSPSGGADEEFRLTIVEYLRERAGSGALYGVFMEDNLAGIIGCHRGGSLGLLYVDTPYRSLGLGASLTAFMTNHMLEKGWVPYACLPIKNVSCQERLEKQGFYKASGKIVIYRKKYLQTNPGYAKI